MSFITAVTSKTKGQFPLSPKKPLKKTLGPAIILFILIIIPAIVVLFFIPLATIILITLYLAIITLIYIYQKWYMIVYFYDLTPSFIVIKKGVFTPKEISIPYERVQDIYVDQDILDRIFGLYDVHISSATITSGIEAHIDGVEKTAADGLKNQLLKTVQEKIKKPQNQQKPAPQ